MKKLFICLLAVSVLLSGCSLLNSNYHSVTPHQDQSVQTEEEVLFASRYDELRDVLLELVHSGADGNVINVPNYDMDRLEADLETAVHYAQEIDAIGAYAVEEISYAMGTNGLTPAVAVKISYLSGRENLSQIQAAKDMTQVREKIGTALQRCDVSIIMLVERYEEADLIQLAEDFARENPDMVMEVPDVTLDVYPESGDSRVVSMKFTYQNSRTDLRQMQVQVSPIFNAATLYVSGSSSDSQKLSQLYAFLMERFDGYQIKTSITPTYSLLHHGVGDSYAFAMVFARMCVLADLECRIVTGTRDGEPWSWNMVLDNGYYYHVDLLRCSEDGGFRMRTDDQMADYVWDYSAYPECSGRPVEVQTETSTEEVTEETTLPEDTAGEETLAEVETENILE